MIGTFETAQPGKLLTVEGRRLKVSQSLIAGMNSREIAEALKVSLTVINTDIRILFKRLKEQQMENAEKIRLKRLYSYDQLRKRYFPKAMDGDLKAAEFCLKLDEREAKLTGVDKPTLIAQTTPDGQAIADQNQSAVNIALEALKRLMDQNIELKLAVQALIDAGYGKGDVLRARWELVKEQTFNKQKQLPEANTDNLIEAKIKEETIEMVER